MGVLENVPNLEGGGASAEQRERAAEVVAAIQQDDGDKAAATFGIGVHNGAAYRLYGGLTDIIIDALQETQSGRACLALGLHVHLRKQAERRAHEAEQEIRDLKRKRKLPPIATYMTWPVETVQLGDNETLIRYLSRNTLEIVPLASLEFLAEKRRRSSSYARPA